MRDERTRKFRRTCIDEAPPNGCHDMNSGSGRNPLSGGSLVRAFVNPIGHAKSDESFLNLLGGQGPAGNTTTTLVQEPWSGVQPYLLDIFQRAQGQYGQGVYGGPYITPQSPYSQQAIQMQAAGATDPNSLISKAQSELGNTISGKYLTLDNNPAAQAAINAATRNVNSQFSGDNYGSSANREWLARASTEAATPFLMQERQNQLNALGLAPGLQVANTNILANSGAAQELRGQAEIDAAQQQFNAPWQNIFNYQQSLTGGQGYGSSAQTSPYFTNPLGSAAGGAATGFGIGGPWGAAIGGILGLLSARQQR